MANLQNERLDRIPATCLRGRRTFRLESSPYGKEVLALRQAMSMQPAARLVLAGDSFAITRDQGTGPEDIEATDRSYVLPADVVRITRFELKQSSLPRALTSRLRPCALESTDPSRSAVRASSIDGHQCWRSG
jgi:hypothetical protein